jgi:hypothetical protein
LVCCGLCFRSLQHQHSHSIPEHPQSLPFILLIARPIFLLLFHSHSLCIRLLVLTSPGR